MNLRKDIINLLNDCKGQLNSDNHDHAKVIAEIDERVAELSEQGFSPWHADDVLDRAERLEIANFSKNDALAVLERLETCHNAELGINWEIIEHHIEEYLKEQGRFGV